MVGRRRRPRSARRWRMPASPATTSPPSGWPGRCTAPSCSTMPTGRCGRRSSGTTSARQPSATRSASASGRERLIEITGNDALTGFTAPKLLWVRNHEPEVWARVAHVLLPKDFVRHRLTGEHAVDRADGAGTLLFDLAARDWSTEVLDALEHRSGLAAADRRRSGGHRRRHGRGRRGDRACGRNAGGGRRRRPGGERGRGRGRGSGAGRALARHVGRRLRGDRSPAHRAGGPRPRVLPRGARTLAPHVGHALGRGQPALVPRRPRTGRGATRPSTRRPAASPPGSDGLLFLPYLTGERSPHPDPLARGAFVGLTVTHDRRHLARAVLEGVAFGLRDGLDQMVATGLRRPSQIRASGGGIASAVWRQILADVLGAADRDGQHVRGRGLRSRAAGRGRRGLVRQRGPGRRPGRPSHAGGRAGTGCGTDVRRGSRVATARCIPPWRPIFQLESDRR